MKKTLLVATAALFLAGGTTAFAQDDHHDHHGGDQGQGRGQQGGQGQQGAGQGQQGATVRVTGPHTAGVIAAFVFGSRGVEAVATGPSDAGSEPTTAVLRMIDSISHTGEGKK